MKMYSIIPSPIFESLQQSQETLRTTLEELAQDKRRLSLGIWEREVAEYLAVQMGYRGVHNVEALVASLGRAARSRQALGLGKGFPAGSRQA
jgi:hypothetical protein